MKKKIQCAAVLIGFLAAIPAAASGSELNAFLDHCGVCHKKGASASPVNPADKAGVVWAKFFERGRHPVDLAGKVTDEQLGEVIRFLQNHAADSDHPVAAVIPK